MQACRIRWLVAWCCGTFFLLIRLLTCVLQQCRSCTYVSVTRRKWIRLKRKPTRALNGKKSRVHARAQCRLFSWKENLPPPLSPSFYLWYTYFSLLYLSIYLSVRLPFTDHFYVDANIFPSFFLIFLPFTCAVSQFRSLRPLVVFTRLSLANGCMSIALTRFSRISDRKRKIEETVHRKGLRNNFRAPRGCFLSIVLTPQ